MSSELTEKMRIIFSGGGTLGPVMPLIAVAEELRKIKKHSLVLQWVGTYGGTERSVIRSHDIAYRSIIGAKWRRYLSIKTFFEPLWFVISLLQSFFIIVRFKPHVLMTAGGFVSVPLHLIAWLFGIPTLVHQQDLTVGLANRIMGFFATKITVTFAHMQKSFASRKTIWTGNPVREKILCGDKDRAIARFHLDPKKQSVLIFGGGSGARGINELVARGIEVVLAHANVLHVTGQGKEIIAPFIRTPDRATLLTHYHSFEFLMDEEMGDAYAAADIIVCRAGLSSISEISALGKAAIIVPIEDSHQMKNVEFFLEKRAIAMVLESEGSEKLMEVIVNLLKDHLERLQLGKMVKQLNKPSAANEIAHILIALCAQKNYH